MYLVLFELPMKRTAVWPSGHMAGKAGFVLGVPRGGPFFVGGVQGGAGGVSLSGGGSALIVSVSLSGSLVFGALSFGGSDGVAISFLISVRVHGGRG